MVGGLPVCDHGWDEEDAKVVCKALGFGGPATAYKGSKFGSVSTSFIMSNVACHGFESHLKDCDHRTRNSCGKWNGAGIQCIIGMTHTMSAKNQTNTEI